MNKLTLVSDFKPLGDQPEAIEALTKGIIDNKRFQTLLGVTGSGKTFTVANVIERVQKPTLVLSHNKTLAAQLYSELKQFFPHNAVEYFVSYYDYYQPEAYIPQTDTYIEKDASINDELERLRLAATSSLMTRRDTIVVASVSCIYGLGSKEDFEELLIMVEKGQHFTREELLKKLVDIQYERNDIDFYQGKFRVRGDRIEVFPAYAEDAIRIEIFDDVVDRITHIDPLTAKIKEEVDIATIYPAKHFVTPYRKIEPATEAILKELDERLKYFRDHNKLLEAQRIETKTRYDMEMLHEIGYCQGIENYSRHLSGRAPGERPSTLIDFFPDDFLMVIDESHVSVPQVRGMFNGDRSRKNTLVEHGFRLPSALDNRPLNFHEFEPLMKNTIFVSATPGPYEFERCPKPIEQVVRPTGLVEPKITVKPLAGEIDDLIGQCRKRVKKHQRVLVTTLTKRAAEDLTTYLSNVGIRVKYLHSGIDVLTRVDVLKGLRKKEFDVLIGVNLLREGLDLPEVALVAILDADKEGFLRSETALIQTSGRAARHIDGEVIMYADKVTNSMQRAISAMDYRREKQLAYNKEHGITPRSVQKAIRDEMSGKSNAENIVEDIITIAGEDFELHEVLFELNREMQEAAENLDFERAAQLRDKIKEIKMSRLFKKKGKFKKVRAKK
ncbi:MAG: excinuclease ABC subunit UvrB [Candidatus Ancaeobacter aquaticus]|nr:excinuclease ABC subunit UvrB [Candidatus Ancaeobacter aquaticus]